jgi:adenylate cyclase class IV
MIEVELKFEVPPQSRVLLQAKLDALPGVRWLGQIVNADSYFDTVSLTCLQQAVFIRIRNHQQLEMKFHDQADPAHTHSTERTFPLKAEPSLMREINALCARFIPGWHAAETVEEAIRVNGLVEYAHIANKRTQYAYGSLTLSIDEVEGLGNFFEIETTCAEETEVEQSLARLRAFVSDLAFPTLRPVRTGYVEQWLQRYRPQIAYLKKEHV